MDFFKYLFSSIVSSPAVRSAAYALLIAVLTAIGVNQVTPAPVINNVTQPVLIQPTPKIDLPVASLVTEEDIRIATAPEAGEGREGVLVKLARRVAGRQYAKEHGLTPQAGIELALSIPYEDVKTAAAPFKAELSPVVNGPILDWIKTHPEEFKQIIQIILMLLPLFA